jgi:predicted RNA-binding Zn-ribbon protein involved in translation (DUF1610 family)
MSAHPNIPICPSCGYDLRELFIKVAKINCPECNRQTTHHAASQRHSRWKFIALCVFAVLIIPTGSTLMCWIMFYANRWGDLSLVFTLFLWLHMIYIPVSTAICLNKENAYRRKPRQSPTNPSMAFIKRLTKIMGICSSAVLTLSILMWIFVLLY